jgi:hypothetical protein
MPANSYNHPMTVIDTSGDAVSTEACNYIINVFGTIGVISYTGGAASGTAPALISIPMGVAVGTLVLPACALGNVQLNYFYANSGNPAADAITKSLAKPISVTAPYYTVYTGANITVTVTISKVLPVSAIITLSASTSNFTIPSSVTIAAGSLTTTFTATAGTSGSSTITATLSGYSATSSPFTVSSTYSTTVLRTYNSNGAFYSTLVVPSLIYGGHFLAYPGANFATMSRIDAEAGTSVTDSTGLNSNQIITAGTPGGTWFANQSGVIFKQGAGYFVRTSQSDGATAYEVPAVYGSLTGVPSLLVRGSNAGITKLHTYPNYTGWFDLNNQAMHTAVENSISGAVSSSMNIAVQNAVQGTRVYAYNGTANQLGYIDTVAMSWVSIATPPVAIDATKVLVDTNGSFYLQPSFAYTTLYKVDSAGTVTSINLSSLPGSYFGVYAIVGNYLWAGGTYIGNLYWAKINKTTMTLEASGSTTMLNSYAWGMTTGMYFSDLTSPVLVHGNYLNLQFGKLVGA